MIHFSCELAHILLWKKWNHLSFLKTWNQCPQWPRCYALNGQESSLQCVDQMWKHRENLNRNRKFRQEQSNWKTLKKKGRPNRRGCPQSEILQNWHHTPANSLLRDLSPSLHDSLGTSSMAKTGIGLQIRRFQLHHKKWQCFQ